MQQGKSDVSKTCQNKELPEIGLSLLQMTKEMKICSHIFPSLLRKNCDSNFNSCRTSSPAAVQLRKLGAEGKISSGRGFRAPHDQRFPAGPRQGSATLDPEKNAMHFSVSFKKKIATAILIRAGLSVLPRSSCASWAPKAKSPPGGDFVLRTTSVSPLDHDKGQRPLTPRKMPCIFPFSI